MGEVKKPELSAVNNLLIRYAGIKTPEEIAELTGLEPIQVAQRTKELLSSIDILDIHERRAKLIIQLEIWADDMAERIPEASDKYAAGILNAVGSIKKTVLAELKAQQKESSGEVVALQARYAQQMVKIVESSYYKQLGRLQERFPDVPVEDLEEEFRETMREVAKEYDAE